MSSFNLLPPFSLDNRGPSSLCFLSNKPIRGVHSCWDSGSDVCRTRQIKAYWEVGAKREGKARFSLTESSQLYPIPLSGSHFSFKKWIGILNTLSTCSRPSLNLKSCPQVSVQTLHTWGDLIQSLGLLIPNLFNIIKNEFNRIIKGICGESLISSLMELQVFNCE